MAPVHGPAVPRRRLGVELRRLREEARLTLEQVAEQLECSTSKISRLETGKGIPKARDVRDMLAMYDAGDAKTRERLLRWVRDGQQQGWWHDYADVIGEKWDTFVALESDAAAMYAYETTVVHGLLQTPEYARAIGEVILTDPAESDLDMFVELRMLRQQVLERDESALRLHVVMEETAIYRPVGGLDVFRGQLAHLLEMTDHPSVNLQVLPLKMGAHAAMGVAFALLTFAEEAGHDIVYVEGVGGAVVLEHERGVAAYRHVFDEIARRALDGENSAAFIASILQGSD